MFQKLLSIVLSVLLTLTSVFLPRLSYSQEMGKFNIAVLDLIANGISLTEAASLSEYMRGQVTRVVTSEEYKKKVKVNYTIIERSQMDKIFDEFEVQNTGCTDVSCAVEFGKMLNVERILIGSVGLVGETYTITTRIVEVETGETVSVADYLFTGKRDNLLREGIPSIVNELMYGKKQKKSRKMLYIVGGAILVSGAIAALSGGVFSSGKNGKPASTTGTISIVIPDPSE